MAETYRLKLKRLMNWSPLSVTETAAVFAKCAAPWWLAGGYAIELVVGQPVRTHHDIDVMMLRRDQKYLQVVLRGWDLFVSDPPGSGALRSCDAAEAIESPLHDLWCRRSPGSPWSLQVMLDEADGENWVSRRDPRIRRQLDSLTVWTTHGIPILAPEIQLYYKAKNVRQKDRIDFAAVLPLLTHEQSIWLDAALALSDPGHPWRKRLPV